MNRAYSLLDIKAVHDEERVIEGIASTPTPDRMDDVVEPLGAQFKLPLPLLWQHNHDEPVGHVEFAQPSKKGIPFKARFAKIQESGTLRDRIDHAWQSVKAGLVRGISIGFRPLKDGYELMDNGGIRWKAWELLEISCVTVPANADCSITAIKSIDHAILAASGHRERAVVRLTPPGASGITPSNPKPLEGLSMKTIPEQIAAFEAKRAASASRMNEIMEKSADDGRTLDEAETEEYDGLDVEVKSIDEHLTRLRKLEQANIAKAVPVSGAKDSASAAQVRGGTIISVRDNLPPGIEFARYVKCLAAANGDLLLATEVARSSYPDNPRIQNVLKANVAAGTTTGTTYAAPLVDYQMFGDFVEYLRPMTVIGKFGTGNIPSLRRVPFNIQVSGQTSGGSGYWVSEGAPKPLTSFDFERITLRWTKVANIAVITQELARFSNPSAEMLIRDALAAALIERIDRDFVDPAKAEVSDTSPASITNGVTPVTASGTNAAAVRADIASVFNTFISANMSPTNGVWIMSATTALAMSLMQNALGQPEFPNLTMMGGTMAGLPVIVSEYVPSDTAGGILILANASDIYLADDGQVTVDVSREASLQMLDNPTNHSGTATATTQISMFQTNSLAVRCERFINWKKRRASAVAYVSGVNYAA